MENHSISTSVSCDCNSWERNIQSLSVESLMDMTINQNLWPMFNDSKWGTEKPQDNPKVMIHVAILRAEGLKALRESVVMYNMKMDPNSYIEIGIKFLIAAHEIDAIKSFCETTEFIDFESVSKGRISVSNPRKDESWSKDSYSDKETRKLSKESGKKILDKSKAETSDEPWDSSMYIEKNDADDAKKKGEELF